MGAGGSGTEGWTEVRLGVVGSFRVPPNLAPQPVTGTDSIFGILTGPGLRILYDYGRFGGPIADSETEETIASGRRNVGGSNAEEVTLRRRDGSGVVRAVQVPRGRESLTLRVECVDVATCAVVDAVFDSLWFF